MHVEHAGITLVLVLGLRLRLCIVSDCIPLLGEGSCIKHSTSELNIYWFFIQHHRERVPVYGAFHKQKSISFLLEIGGLPMSLQLVWHEGHPPVGLPGSSQDKASSPVREGTCSL